jgi:hypothetical protein
MGGSYPEPDTTKKQLIFLHTVQEIRNVDVEFYLGEFIFRNWLGQKIR